MTSDCLRRVPALPGFRRECPLSGGIEPESEMGMKWSSWIRYVVFRGGLATLTA